MMRSHKNRLLSTTCLSLAIGSGVMLLGLAGMIGPEEVAYAACKPGHPSAGQVSPAAPCNPCAALRPAAGPVNPSAGVAPPAALCNPCAALRPPAALCNPCAARRPPLPDAPRRP